YPGASLEVKARSAMKLKTASMVLGISIALAGCAQSPSAPAGGPLPVTVSYPVEREVTDFSDLTGRTAAIDSVEIRPRVFGYLDKVNFKEGQLVKKGDVLFEIDSRTYLATQKQAAANVEIAEARLQRLEADWARARELLDTKAISRAEFDKI